MLLFALAVLIHEFGHFIAARLLGMRVEAFSIFFGKPVWKKKIGECEYRIGWIPLGGYVALPDLDPDGVKALEGSNGETAATADVPAWKKILVAVAGPLGNIVLAVALACMLAAMPGAKFGTTLPKIGDVIEGGPAYRAGLMAGDLVTKVGGKDVSTWYEMQVEIQLSKGGQVPFSIVRGEEEMVLAVEPVQDEDSGVWLILAASEAVKEKSAAWMPDRNPLRQLEWDVSSIARILKALVTPKEAKAAANSLGGPVNIAESLYRQVRRDFADGLGFLRFLNVNLAMINLLPIPVLDGGLILFALFELIARRKVNKKFSTIVTTAFMWILMGLMGIIIVRDVVRSWNIHHAEPKSVEQLMNQTHQAEETE